MPESKPGSLYIPAFIKGDWQQHVSKYPLKKPEAKTQVLRKLGRQMKMERKSCQAACSSVFEESRATEHQCSIPAKWDTAEAEGRRGGQVMWH